MTATNTVNDAQATVQMGLPKLLFSLSSASILLIPLALCATLAAIVANIEGPLDYLTRLIPRSWTLSNYTELFFGGANVNTNANITQW